MTGETKTLAVSYSYNRSEAEAEEEKGRKKEIKQRTRLTTLWIQQCLLGQQVEILSVAASSAVVLLVSESAGVQGREVHTTWLKKAAFL